MGRAVRCCVLFECIISFTDMLVLANSNLCRYDMEWNIGEVGSTGVALSP